MKTRRVLIQLVVLMLTILLVCASSNGSSPPVLFSEDWELGTIDPAKWRTFGSPQPAVYPGRGREGSYAVNNNGDPNYDSGLTALIPFDITQGISVEFWVRGHGPIGHYWTNNYVGLGTCSPDDDNERSCRNFIVSIYTSAEDNAVAYTAQTESGGEQWRETWEPLDDEWHKYGFTIAQDGLVSFYRDGELKFNTSAPIDFGLYSQLWLQIRGRSWNSYYYVDDLLVIELNMTPHVDTGPDQMASEGDTVSLAPADFTDLDVLDTHTATIDWGDGSPVEAGTVSESDGSGIVSGSHVYGDDGTYTVTVAVCDDDDACGEDSFTVTVHNLPPAVDAGPDVTINEGDTFSGSGSFADPGSDTWAAAVDYGDGSGSQPLTLTGNAFALSRTYVDNGAYTVEVCVTDDDDGIGCDTLTVTVLNVAPTVGEISAPVDPVEVNTAINTSADFTDPGVLDTHTAVWDWGDGTTSSGTVNETDGSGSVSGSHIYTTADVYTVKLTVTDKDGDSGQSVFEYVVVYDPKGGFVTGGGWINSPAGAYAPDPSLTGKATFGFVAKYKKGADTPTGQTEFQFRVADLNFHSDTYQWLVVAGPKAQFKGIGTINGEGKYGFMLTAIDAELTPSTEVDKFRIKIWDKDNGDTIVYDNQLGEADDADPTTVIGGGSIVIHKAK